MSNLPVKSNQAIEQRTQVLDLLMNALEKAVATGIAANSNEKGQGRS